MTLDELRGRLDELDRRFIELIAERQRIIGDIARAKQATGFPLRDYAREKQVLEGARANARAVGVSEEVAEAVVRSLIRYSLTQQEQASVVAHRGGNGRRALVIGGAGRMGRWLAQFLASQGFLVDVADPAAIASESSVSDWRALDLTHDFIVVAAPLEQAGKELVDLAGRRPTGVVFDVCSLKSPVREGIQALRDASVAVASIHPMFGPDVQLLSGRRVVFVETGDEVALGKVQALFAPTMVGQVTMTLDDHDRLIAYILGLSHAVNIAFFTALQSSGEGVPRLMEVASTTFLHQMEVARRVAQESPELYYRIQQMNDFGLNSLEALRDAVDQILQAVETQDEAAFLELMNSGRKYTANRRRAGPGRSENQHHTPDRRT